jgi:hypothetical protein
MCDVTFTPVLIICDVQSRKSCNPADTRTGVGESPAVVPKQLMGALYSTGEAMVDPREALARLPSYLQERHGIAFKWGKCVNYIADNRRTITDPFQKFRQSAFFIVIALQVRTGIARACTVGSACNGIAK